MRMASLQLVAVVKTPEPAVSAMMTMSEHCCDDFGREHCHVPPAVDYAQVGRAKSSPLATVAKDSSYPPPSSSWMRLIHLLLSESLRDLTPSLVASM